MITEKNIQGAIIHYLQAKGYIVWRLNSGKYFVDYGEGRRRMIQGLPAGTPDIIFFKEGKTFFIEVKKPKGKLTEYQERMHEELKDEGFDVLVIRSIDECMEIF